MINMFMNLLTLSAVILVICRCKATVHYCENGDTKRVDVSFELGQDEKLMPMVDTASSAPTGAISCKWEAEARKLDGPALVVVSGYNASERSTRRAIRSIGADPETNSTSHKMYFQLLGPQATCSGRVAEAPEPVAKETFRVLQLLKGSFLSVTYESQAHRARSQLPPGLMMQLVETGFCSREMASFQHSCYRVTPRQLSLRAELARLSGDGRVLQLASFHSLEMIRQFVEANDISAVFFGGGLRSKVPLDLSQPVRIGLFYSGADKSIKFINSTGGHECLLQDVQDPQSFAAPATDSGHSCGSLRVDQRTGREVVEFGDCGERLPALVSFGDSPRSVCGDCGEPVVNWLRSHAGYDDATTQLNPTSVVPVAASRLMTIVAIILAAGIVALVAALVPTMLFFRRARGSHKGAASTMVKKDLSYSAPSESLLPPCNGNYLSVDKTKLSMSNGMLNHTALVQPTTPALEMWH